MNEQHKISKLNNRRRRVARRIAEVEGAKQELAKSAELQGYEPDLSKYYIQLKALRRRLEELEA